MTTNELKTLPTPELFNLYTRIERELHERAGLEVEQRPVENCSETRAAKLQKAG